MDAGGLWTEVDNAGEIADNTDRFNGYESAIFKIRLIESYALSLAMIALVWCNHGHKGRGLSASYLAQLIKV